MEIREKTVTIRTIVAGEGMWLTQVTEVTERIFAKSVTLGKYDSPDNWREVTDEWKEEWEREHAPQEDNQQVKL